MATLRMVKVIAKVNELNSPLVEVRSIKISRPINDLLLEMSGWDKTQSRKYITTFMEIPVIIDPQMRRDMVKILYVKDGILMDTFITGLIDDSEV